MGLILHRIFYKLKKTTHDLLLGEADQAEAIGNILLVQAYTNVTDGILPPLLCVEYWGYWRPEQLHYQSFMHSNLGRQINIDEL